MTYSNRYTEEPGSLPPAMMLPGVVQSNISFPAAIRIHRQAFKSTYRTEDLLESCYGCFALETPN